MKWRITLGLLIFSLMSIAQTIPTDAQQLLQNPAFLNILQRHLSNLNQVQSASAMSMASNTIQLDEGLYRMSANKNSEGSSNIDQAAYRQACEALLNDPVFLDELVNYLGQLETVMAENIYDPPVADDQEVDHKLPLTTVDTLSSMQIIYDRLAEKFIEKLQSIRQLAAAPQAKVSTEKNQEVVLNKRPLEEFQLPSKEERAKLTPSTTVQATVVSYQEAKPTSTTHYYLQMGYFRDPQNAQNLMNKLQAQYLDQPISMHLVSVNGKMRTRVRMGYFEDPSIAQGFSKDIRRDGFSSYVRKEDL